MEWSVLTLLFSGLGLLVAVVLTLREINMYTRRFKNPKLQITNVEGNLIGMIDIAHIDKEDPRKLDRVLEEIARKLTEQKKTTDELITQARDKDQEEPPEAS